MARHKHKEDYLIKSVSNSLDVLEAFSGKQAELGVTELSAKLRLHKNNVFRILATLEVRGYVEQNKATENYRLGIKSLQLGQAFLQQVGFLKQARPIIERLAEETNETIYVGVMRGTEVIYLDCIASEQRVTVVSRVGTRVPAYAAAMGKAMLAFEGADEVKKRLPDKLTAFTKTTLTAGGRLMDQLEQSAKSGWALEDEEFEEGVRCAGVAIRDHSKRVIGGLSVSGPAYRLTKEKIEKEIAPRLLKAGHELSQRLGFGTN